MKHLLVRRGLIVVLVMIIVAGCATTRRHWEIAQSADTIEAYEKFLDQHPKSEFTQQAQARLEHLYAQRDWNQAETTGTIEAYEEFLVHHPQSEFTDKARSRLKDLRIERDWKQAHRSGTIEAYKDFLRQHPQSSYAPLARSNLDSLSTERDWQIAHSTDTIESYEEFLNRYQQSQFSEEARSRLEELRRDRRAWEEVKETGSLRACQHFIENNPQNAYLEEAKAFVADYEADIAGREIADALKGHRIEAQVTGSGIENVRMKIRRLVNHKIRVVVPVGTYFVCRGSAQNMVGREEEVFVLHNDDWKSIRISAACANRSRDIPDSDESFDIRESPHQDELRRLMPILQKAGVSFGIEQAAVWIVTDNADYHDLGTLVQRPPWQTFGGTRVIQEYEAAKAMRICDQAGIDIIRKAIWRDVGKILNGLKDENLRRWLRQRSEK